MIRILSIHSKGKSLHDQYPHHTQLTVQWKNAKTLFSSFVHFSVFPIDLHRPVYIPSLTFMSCICFHITGQNVKVEAIISGNPYPTVQWYKGNDQIVDGDKFKIVVSILSLSTTDSKKACFKQAF